MHSASQHLTSRFIPGYAVVVEFCDKLQRWRFESRRGVSIGELTKKVTVQDWLSEVVYFVIHPGINFDSPRSANKPRLKLFGSRDDGARDKRNFQRLKDSKQERYFVEPKSVRSLLAMVRQELPPDLGILQQVGADRTPKIRSTAVALLKRISLFRSFCI